MPLNEEQLSQLESELQSLKDELQQQLQLAEDSSKPVVLDQTLAGRVSRNDAIQQQHMAKAAKVRDQKHFVQVVQALHRIQEEPEDFGYCEECGDEIALQRLKIQPESQFCIACKEAMEADL